MESKESQKCARRTHKLYQTRHTDRLSLPLPEGRAHLTSSCCCTRYAPETAAGKRFPLPCQDALRRTRHLFSLLKHFKPNSSDHPCAALVTGSSAGTWVDVPKLSNTPHQPLDFPPSHTQATPMPRRQTSSLSPSVGDRPGA